MLEITKKLVELLYLTPAGEDHYRGDSQDLGFPHVFGGTGSWAGVDGCQSHCRGPSLPLDACLFSAPGQPAYADRLRGSEGARWPEFFSSAVLLPARTARKF